MQAKPVLGENQVAEAKRRRPPPRSPHGHAMGDNHCGATAIGAGAGRVLPAPLNCADHVPVLAQTPATEGDSCCTAGTGVSRRAAGCPSGRAHRSRSWYLARAPGRCRRGAGDGRHRRAHWRGDTVISLPTVRAHVCVELVDTWSAYRSPRRTPAVQLGHPPERR